MPPRNEMDEPSIPSCKRARLQTPIAPTFHEDDSIFELLEPLCNRACLYDDVASTQMGTEIDPTEIDSSSGCSPTEIESSSKGSSALHGGSLEDSLMGWFDTPVASPSPSQPAEYDPDDTDNEDPSKPEPIPTAPARPHHMQDPTFLDLVADETALYARESWFSFAPFFWGKLTDSFDVNVDFIYSYISAGRFIPDDAYFKIGITRDPRHRWFIAGDGHYARFYDPRLCM